jgi:hypothetical protein
MRAELMLALSYTFSFKIFIHKIVHNYTINGTSVRGNYSDRRRVPQKLKYFWGLSEVKFAFKTKNHAEALRRAASHNTDFEYRKARLTLLSAGKPLSTEHLSEEAREILITKGIHPQ